jgi:hypothetical protein
MEVTRTMRKVTAVALATALLITLSGTALAAKGGNGNGNSTGNGGNPGSGATASGITLDQSVFTLSLGTPVTFTTSVVGLVGNEYALVYLKCVEGDTVVYGQLDLPGTTFVLGGGSSPWWQVGGIATCVGYLEAYGTHGGHDTTRVLAQTGAFTAN